MKPYAFFLDIDGTIFDRDCLPDRNVRAIAEARRRGHLFFLNTGRGYAHIPAEVTRRIRFDGFVCALGTYVRVGDEVLLNVPMPRELTYRSAEMMLSHPLGGRLQGEKYIFHVGHQGEDGIRIMSLEELDRYPDFICNKITFDGHPRRAWLRELSKDLRIYRFPDYTEGGTRGYDKATGIRCVLEHLGLERERPVAIGDSRNDEDMLRDAGLAVVPADGERAMRRIADRVIGRCREGGVGAFLEDFLGMETGTDGRYTEENC